MAKNPDPSYWGNPPQTPTRNNTPSYPQPQPAQPAQPIQPQGSPVAQPYPSPSPQQTQPQQGPVSQPGSQSAQAPQPQPQTTPTPQPQPVQPQWANQPGQAPNFPPAPKPPKKHRGCLIAAIIAVILVFLLGIAGCVACTSAITSSPSAQQLEQNYLLPLQPDAPDPITDSTVSVNNEFFRDAFGLSGTAADAAITTDDLNTIQSSYFSENSKKPNKEGLYSDGVYFVGSDLPQGSYWFTGSNDELSYFFILEPTETEGTFNVDHINNYYGHNLMEVEEGEVLVLVNNGTMQPLDSFKETFSAPYLSGTYRVGTDIPAGTYQLSLGEANDYSACYVMSDLDFDTDSYLYEAYYIEGDDPEEITLDEGTYVELYNMSMKPIVM